MKKFSIVRVAGVLLALASGSALAVPPDFSTLTAAVDFSTVNAAILTIMAGLALVYIIMTGGGLILDRLRRR